MLTISIQAGGKSSRMGQDKALLPFLGQPLIQRVMQRLSSIADEILVTSNNPVDYKFLNIPIFTDIIPDAGALGGLYTALKASTHSCVAVVGCDLPFANPDLLGFCRDILQENDYDAVIPMGEKGVEPLHAVYRVSGCLLAVEHALNAGKRRMISWHDQANIHILPRDITTHYDPQGIAFFNVNTPAEFKRAEEKAKSLDLGK
jgi:molybdopterin-guanine dinucleotide biosynthesis protein A